MAVILLKIFFSQKPNDYSLVLSIQSKYIMVFRISDSIWRVWGISGGWICWTLFQFYFVITKSSFFPFNIEKEFFKYLVSFSLKKIHQLTFFLKFLQIGIIPYSNMNSYYSTYWNNLIVYKKLNVGFFKIYFSLNCSNLYNVMHSFSKSSFF